MELLAASDLNQLARSRSPLAADYILAASLPASMPFIRNVQTDLRALVLDEHVFPVSINETGAIQNSYVVSPQTAYSGYADEELSKLKLPWLEWTLRRVVRVMGAYLYRQKIDHLVQINNWLLSTNLYPASWKGAEIPNIVARFTAEFPEHAIGFRSLNRVCNADLIDRLQAAGFELIPSRQVYFFDGREGRNSPFFLHHNTRIDQALARKKNLTIVPHEQITSDDFHRLEEIYNQLYLEKYSRFNPQFSARWLAHGHADGWLKLAGIREPKGRIDGVVGWFSTADVLTAPIVGYDTRLPQKGGLYRILTAMCLAEAAERRVRLNFSAGAAHFKQMRGGVPCIEYSAVYFRHLPRARRLAWRTMQTLLNTIAVPLMKVFKL